MDLFQISELSIHLTKNFIESTSDVIAWHEIRSMRNRFGHNYYDMNFKIIYETARYDIPKLEKFVNQEIDKLYTQIEE